tara:strand:- start:11 stop:532 length:522 start_codon:yes stop_codon:yes gene_type:complete
MTIQTINIGAAPNDDTGDDPRTAGQKLNSNFTTNTHAASRDVGTSAGNIPDADDLSMVGATENYTSNNLNPNVFDAVSTLSVIAESCYASSATTLIIALPISMINAPQSITVVGTFNIRTRQAAIITSGVSPALASNSTNKTAILTISGLTGLTIGDSYVLWADAAASKITVN